MYTIAKVTLFCEYVNISPALKTFNYLQIFIFFLLLFLIIFVNASFFGL